MDIFIRNLIYIAISATQHRISRGATDMSHLYVLNNYYEWKECSLLYCNLRKEKFEKYFTKHVFQS